MKIEDILEKLAFNEGHLPRKALREAIAKREKITPFLLNIIKVAREDFDTTVEMCDDDYMGHIYAMFLLAQFRETRAYPLIVDLFSIPGDDIIELAGDVVTEDLGRILASVCGGDTSLIEQLAENEEANEYVRGAALESFLTLVAEGEKSREEVMAYYSSFLKGRLEKWPSHVLSNVVSCCSDLYPDEVMEDIKRAFSKELIDESFIDMSWIEDQLALGKDRVLEIMADDHHHRYIRNVIDEMEWWSCFNEREEVIVREKEKVGRNQPCPCGSGKKYKKCCGATKQNEQDLGFLKHAEKVGEMPGGGPDLYQVDRNVPVVENGYRIVGPAQAMMDYAKPLIDMIGKDDKKGFDSALTMAQVCWSIAVTKNAEDEKKIRKSLLKKKIIDPDTEAFIDIMIERHHLMFPFIHQDAGFYIREKIIDEPEDMTFFDESGVALVSETFPADKKEETLIKELKKIDSYVESGVDWSKYDKKFHSFQKRIVRRYGDWCEKKGLDGEEADNFCTAVERYLDFVYQYDNGTLFTVDERAIREFVTLFWIRKTYAEPYELSVMPKALELFYVYLKEKGFSDIVDKFILAINNSKPEFLVNLEAYFTPE